MNLKKEKGREIFFRLMEQYNIFFIENFTPGTLDRLDIGYEEQKKVNPKIIYCSSTAYGEGPYRDYPGFDPVVESFSGLMDTNGFPNMPTRLGTSGLDSSHLYLQTWLSCRFFETQYPRSGPKDRHSHVGCRHPLITTEYGQLFWRISGKTGPDKFHAFARVSLQDQGRICLRHCAHRKKLGKDLLNTSVTRNCSKMIGFQQMRSEFKIKMK